MPQSELLLLNAQLLHSASRGHSTPPAPTLPGVTAPSQPHPPDAECACAPVEDAGVQRGAQHPADERHARQQLDVLQRDPLAAAARQHQRGQVGARPRLARLHAGRPSRYRARMMGSVVPPRACVCAGGRPLGGDVRGAGRRHGGWGRAWRGCPCRLGLRTHAARVGSAAWPSAGWIQ